MKELKLSEVNKFVNENIDKFHMNRIESLEKLKLKDILKKKNPYLYKAKNINLATGLVSNLLDAFLSSSEEKSFGNFLEDFAVFVSGKICGGRKSSATGIDLEFNSEEIHYVVSVKSGPNWGNSSQHKAQEHNFKTAVQVLRQSSHTLNVQPVLGICYGRTRTGYVRGYRKIVGQNFWYFISGDENLYTDIIEPLGYRAKQHNEKFEKEKARLVNLFTQEFMKDFCLDGNIDWQKLVEFNSGNLDLK